MAQRTLRSYLVLLNAAFHLFPATSLARGDICNEVDTYTIFNATKTVTIPALQINRTEEQDEGFNGHVGGLIVNPNDSWYFTTHLVSRDGFVSHDFLNTGSTNSSDLDDIGFCLDAINSHSLTRYEFPRKVIERSVNDTGDCMTMLGEECVSALKEHYARDARKNMIRGGCMGESDWNSTVPFQCASLIGGSERWNGGSIHGGDGNLTQTWTQQKFQEAGCGNLSQVVNSTIHPIGGGLGGLYNQTIRFPQLHFLSFFPNRSSVVDVNETQWDMDVQVQLLCVKPDDIQQGSTVPPTAQELLDRSDASYPSYPETTTKTPSSTQPGAPSPTPSPTGAAANVVLSWVAPYMGAMGMGMLILV